MNNQMLVYILSKIASENNKDKKIKILWISLGCAAVVIVILVLRNNKSQATINSLKPKNIALQNENALLTEKSKKVVSEEPIKIRTAGTEQNQKPFEVKEDISPLIY